MIGSGEGLDGGGGGGDSSLVAMKNFPVESFYNRNATTSDVIREALRQTEMRIAEQVSMALAADQRAMTFAGLLMVVFVLLVGTSTTVTRGLLSDISVALLFASTLLSVYSAKPTRLYGTGSTSNSLLQYLSPDYAGYAVSGLIARNNESILKNDKAVKGAALIFRLALISAFFAFASVALEFWLESSEVVKQAQKSEAP